MPDRGRESNNEILLHLGRIEGQVSQLMSLMASGQSATNQRLDDMHKSIDRQLHNHEQRIGKLEDRERSTAIKASIAGTVSAAIVSASIAFMRKLI